MSAHRTSETGSGLWRTLQAQDGMRGVYKTKESMDAHLSKGRQLGLANQVAHRYLWPTPTASMMPCEGTVRIMRKQWLEGKMSLEEASAIAGRDVRKSQGKVEAWPTPTASNAKNNGSASQMRRNTKPLDARVGGALNPMWVEWLMGWPLGWTDLKPLETDKFQQWLEQHGRL